MLVKPCLMRAFAILLLAIAGNSNESHFRKLGRLADASRDLITVEAGKANIKQNRVGSEGFGRVNDRCSLVDLLRGAAKSFEKQAESSRAVDVILNNHDS